MIQIRNVPDEVGRRFAEVTVLGIDQAVSCPSLGAGVVVFGAPLVIDDEKPFTITDDDLLGVLTDAIARVHAQEVVYGTMP